MKLVKFQGHRTTLVHSSEEYREHDMLGETNPAILQRIEQLELELTGLDEFIAKIDLALSLVEPDDIDRLTEEGGRKGILVRRKQEIETELASLRGEASISETSDEVLVLSCVPIVSGVACYSIAFTPDGTSLLSGGYDGLVLRDATTGDVMRTYDIGTGRLSVAVSPDGRFVAGRHYDEGAIVFDLASGSRKASEPSAKTQANISFSADSKALLAVLSETRNHVTFWRFMGPHGPGHDSGPGFSQEIVFFALTPNGKALFATEGPRSLLFGMLGGQPNDCPTLSGGFITAAAFASGNPLAILGNSVGRIGVGILSESSPDHFKVLSMHIFHQSSEGRIQDLDISPDGRFFAARVSEQVLLFRVNEGHSPTHLATYTGIGGVDVVARRALLFASDGRSFVTAGYTGIFRGDISQFL